MDSQLVRYGGMVVVGMVLGAIFFGGLWLTIRHMASSSRPWLVIVTSVILRSAVVLVGIWYVASDDAMAIGSCLLGFIAIRLLVTRYAARRGPEISQRKVQQ